MNFLKRKGNNSVNLDLVMRIEPNPPNNEMSKPHIKFVLPDDRWNSYTFETEEEMNVYYSKLMDLIDAWEVNESDESNQVTL